MTIVIHDLRKTYGRTHALDGLDLDLGPGIHGLLGANGAGKTTLMRILAGIIRPTSGRVVAAGHDLGDRQAVAAYQRTLGYLPQDLGLYPELTCRETVDYIAALKLACDRGQRRGQVAAALDLVGLGARAGLRVRDLSGGMRRRLGIAQAIVGDPAVLIVDEPTAGLDPVERARFRDLLAALAGERTVLLSTHIIDDIAGTCPRLTVLDGGRALFHGATADLVAGMTGRVWTLARRTPPDTCDLVLAASQSGDLTSYRVLASTPPGPDAKPAAPRLEDAYLALVQANGLDGGRTPSA